ncbi:MAG: hypothetical protein LBC62_02015 [Treponema sp.]|jgi:xylan 1,4-beta-xylosidase|nr:hypothetical protein [Treponema sp.]
MIRKDIVIDVQGERKPFKHFYRATGYANADYTYTPPLRRMYDCLASYDGHPEYMRLHNILTLHGRGDYYIAHEGMDYGNPAWNKERVDVVVRKDDTGTLRFNWEYVDTVYDIILNHGMHPIVETVYMPQVISKDPGNYYLPKDFKLWEEVVGSFVRHWVERYGLEEVRKWYFEIWNEPDNHEEWNNDPSSFFALYDYFEYAVHHVDERLKAGGPAVKQWENGQRIFRAFLHHCNGGINYRSGTCGARLDFISVHSKGGHPSLVGPSIDYMFNPLREFVKTLKEFPRYRETEFINDESDIVWEGNQGTSHKSWLNFRNTHYAPGFTAKMICTYCSILEDELQVNLSMVDSDNCHLAWEKSFFSGNRSQFTPLGPAPCSDIIRKPVFNIFPLLAKLGTERYLVNSPDDEYGIKYGALPTRDGENGYAILLWNFEDGLVEDVNERCIRLRLNNTEAAEYYPLHFRIDGGHSNAYGAWCKMGRPYPLKPDQIRVLRDCEGLELAEAPRIVKGNTAIELEISIPMHGVSLIKLVKAPPEGRKDERAIRNGVELLREEGFAGNTQVFIHWDYSASADLAGYQVYRKKNGDTTAIRVNKSESTQCSWYVDMDVEKGVEYIYSVSVLYADGSESPHSPERGICC